MAKGNRDETLARMAALFTVLADGTRLAILQGLFTNGAMTVGNLVAVTGCSQANVSKHLKLMAMAGVLARRKTGLYVYYNLKNAIWEQVFQLVRSLVPNGTGK